MCHLHCVYFSLCFSWRVRPAAFLPCNSPLWIHYLNILILIALSVPRCRQNINMHTGFSWRLYLCSSLCPLRRRETDLWRGQRPGCSHCWHLHRFFPAKLSSSLAPWGGSNWFQELLGIFPSFTDIFPSPINTHTHTHTHTHNLLATKLSHFPWDC